MIVGLYTEFHLYKIYSHMFDNMLEYYIDEAGVGWNVHELGKKLVNEYGYANKQES